MIWNFPAVPCGIWYRAVRLSRSHAGGMASFFGVSLLRWLHTGCVISSAGTSASAWKIHSLFIIQTCTVGTGRACFGREIASGGRSAGGAELSGSAGGLTHCPWEPTCSRFLPFPWTERSKEMLLCAQRSCLGPYDIQRVGCWVPAWSSASRDPLKIIFLQARLKFWASQETF